ncbi:MAG TPA: hypothetical protein PLT92_13675 [Ignavibacteriaceae bacterium]|nr:hypothetical protein [Ignavibacteriaceae bacterium]
MLGALTFSKLDGWTSFDDENFWMAIKEAIAGLTRPAKFLRAST